MKIALISCSKNKKDYKCRAVEMYSNSTLFKKTLNFCKGYDKIMILSAKYGAICCDDEIEPYEQTLNGASKKDKVEWASKCLNSLMSIFEIEKCQFDFFTGINYYEPLKDLLPHSNFPMRGLGIGERLRFLSL